MAVQHNFDVKIQELGVDIARHQLDLSYGIYDPTLNAIPSHSYNLSPGGIDQQNRPFPGTTTDRDGLTVGVGGLLPTGLNYELGTIGGDFFRSYGTAPGGPFENAGGSVGIQLRQPLLKDAWIDAPRLNIKVSKKQLKISELALRGQLMNTVTSVELTYYDLLLARDEVKVQQQALALAQELLAANRDRVKQGVMATLDEKQAASQVAVQRSILLSAMRAVGTQENLLKRLLSDKFSDWQDEGIQPTEALTAVPEKVQRNECWQQGITMRPDLLQARQDLERLGYIVKFNYNQIFPQLDVFGSYGGSGSDTQISGALGQIRQVSNPFYSYGLQLKIPLGNRTARENYKISKLNREQSELVLQQLEQDILLQIDDAVKVVETNFERVGTTREAREFAEAALQAEQVKMENGKSTSFFVLQFQRDLTSASSEEIRALAEYNKALAQLALRDGTVLERHKLDVEIK